MEAPRRSTLTAALLAVIVILTVLGILASVFDKDFIFLFLPGQSDYHTGGAVFEVIYALLTMATDVLYLVGGAVVFFGGILVTIRFVQIKLKDPNKPSEVTRHLSGYLTLGLAFFIGAEIVKTVVVRTTAEFELLILTIVSRGLFSLILYLERRWHGAAETE
jgi:uncharacterized membrane protein